MKSPALPIIGSDLGAEWKQHDDRHALCLNRAIRCGSFTLQLFFLTKSTKISLERREALAILDGKLSAGAQKLPLAPWQRSSAVGPIHIETIRDSLVLITTNNSVADEQGDLSNFSNPALQLPNQPDAFLVRWLEFPLVPGLYRTQPDVVVGDWHIKLWRALPTMNCGIHRHSKEPWMKETHFLLAGTGDMVKYRDDNQSTEFERTPIEFGETHPPFFTENPNGTVAYPWHAWQAGPNGSLFVALENWALKKE